MSGPQPVNPFLGRVERLKGQFVAFSAFVVLLGHGASAQVVINEVFYNAPNDVTDLQWIELHNSGSRSLDLSGWSFAKGIQFRFAHGTRIDAGGFVVLCRSTERFRSFYGTEIPLAGEFASSISRKGERLDLADAAGKVVDSVKYKDSDPWPVGPDGESASLERICPTSSGDDVANWTSSPLNDDRSQPGGTPGKVNAGYSKALPPRIRGVSLLPTFPKPDEALAVEAEAETADVARVQLRYRIAGAGFENPEVAVPMAPVGNGRFKALVPGQKAGSLVRVRVEAQGTNGALRVFPAATDLNPALSAYVPTAFEPAAIPYAWIIPTTEAELEASRARRASPGVGPFGGFGGFDGGPPVAPPIVNPVEEARVRARGELERDLDLSTPWFALTALTEPSPDAWDRLRAGMRAKLEERNRWIADRLAAATSEEAIRALAAAGKEYRTTLAKGWAIPLSDPQRAALETWVTNGGRAIGSPFASAIIRRVDLEGVWHAITLNADAESGRRASLRQMVVEWRDQRDEIVASVERGEGQETRFRDQRERADGLRDAISSSLKDKLNPSQLQEFEAWWSQPREITVGLRPFPPTRGGPRGPGQAGPDGFGGRGGPRGFFGGRGFGRRGQADEDATSTASHRTAFVYYDPSTRRMELFDFVQVTGRKGGQKVRFHKGQALDGMSTINLTFEGEMAAIVEALAYEVYRRAGVLTSKSQHVRLWQGGELSGYQLLFEQPNRAFLRNRNLRDDGNLYKLLWFEDGVVGQHEKKSPSDRDHRDVVALVDALENTEGEAEWEVIRKHFDLDEVAGFFAVNTVLSHWDGFFNNYFAYHDVHGTGKWFLIPWDQDSTWGLRAMGRTRGGVFFDMPLTFGMNGDQPAGGNWRPPGWFSGPLLAHPKFRELFLDQTRRLLESVYHESVMEPVIAAMEANLVPETRIRAELQGQDPVQAEASLRGVFAGARDHLRKRREFLLSQSELKKAGSR